VGRKSVYDVSGPQGGGIEDITGGAPRSLSWPAAQMRSRREGWEGERGFFGVAGGSEGFLLGGFLDRALKGRALCLRKAVSFGCGREWRSGRWLAVVRVRNVVQERRRPAVRGMAPWGTVVVVG